MKYIIYHLATNYSSNHFIAAQFESHIQIWDEKNKNRINNFKTIYDGGNRLAISPGSDYCGAGAYHIHGVGLYKVENAALLWQRKDLKKVQWLGFDKNNILLAGFDDKPLHVLDFKTGETIKKIRGVRKKVVSPFNDYFVLESNDIEIFNSTGHKIIVKRATFAVLDYVFGPDILYLTESAGGLRAISCETGKLIWRYIPEKDSHFLKLGYNQKLNQIFGILWNYNKGGDKILVTFDAKDGGVLYKKTLECETIDTCFFANGSRLATSDGTIFNLEEKFEPTFLVKLNFAEVAINQEQK